MMFANWPSLPPTRLPARRKRLHCAAFEELQQVSRQIPGLYWVVGLPARCVAPGKKLINAPRVIQGDEVLKLLIEGRRLAPGEYEKAAGFVDALRKEAENRAMIERIRGMIARNEYKRRQAPPIIRLRARAFGTGREMPIAARLE